MPLVEQLGKRFYLTAAGKKVLAASQEILSRFKLLESSLNELKGLEKGHLSLSKLLKTFSFFNLSSYI